MKIKEISFLEPITSINIKNDWLDVFVTVEDDDCNDQFHYLVEVATPQYLSSLMEKFNSKFVSPSYPCIIVAELTDQVIRAAIQAFMDEEDNLYWLKLYHVTATLNIDDLNEILDRKNQENVELEAKIDAVVETE
jgi:hypothetical protein